MISSRSVVSAAAAASIPAVLAVGAGHKLMPKHQIEKRAYTAAQTYSGSSFFDGWDVITGADSGTSGLVNYVNDPSIMYVDANGVAIMKVDNSSDITSGSSRNSVRIQSQYLMSIGSLLIGDIAHVPAGCSVWPAFWAYGPDWPAGGEIDIFEGVNLNTNNQMTLHTSTGCTQVSPTETGTTLATDCDVNADGNAGCGVQDPSTDSYGSGFNSAGGGVWATLWDTDGISVWFFTRDSIPADITSGSPDPTTWGTATANWPASGCDPSTYFNNLQITFDITLCGVWAGADSVWASSGCSGTCADTVASAANFAEAYFAVNSVAVYTSA